jgi:glycosyltransferase involved in cell wall biosynthesis
VGKIRQAVFGGNEIIMSYEPFFSLILATLNRPTEVQICLKSLSQQTFRNFEIIIIDQSNNNDTEVIKNEFPELRIYYFKVEFKGLSKARNFGLNRASGKYFCLIDDDASYNSEYLKIAYDFICENGICVLSGYMWNPITNTTLPEYFKTKTKSSLSVRKIIRMCPSPALIFPMELCRKGKHFDEKLGVGSYFGACEETDLFLEALDTGYRGYYIKELKIEHPVIMHSFEIENVTAIKRVENYARGLGALIKKDIILRKRLRLIPTLMEKRIKLFLKFLGVLGVTRKQEAIAEWAGIKAGFREYRQDGSDSYDT